MAAALAMNSAPGSAHIRLALPSAICDPHRLKLLHH
jgi:hypothetical protein